MNKQTPQNKSISKRIKVIFIILGTTIIIYGIFLRVYNINVQSWWIDEAYSINAAVSTIEKGYPVLDSGWVYKGQLAFTYPLSASIKAFGLHNWSTRLPSVIFNILFLGVMFQFCRRFFNMRVAILTTLFLTFSYWEIAWARQARNYAMFQLFFWTSIYYFWEIIFNKFTYKNLIFWISASAITLFTHGLALLLIPIYGVSFIVKFWEKIIKENIKLLKNKKVIIGIFALVIMLMLFRGNIMAVLTGKTLPSFYRTNYIKFAIDHFTTTFAIAFIPLICFYKTNLNKKTVFLVIYYLLFLITATFFINLPGHRYLFVVLPVLYILAAFGIDTALGKKNKLIKPLAICAFIILLFLSKEFKFIPTTNYFLESDPTRAQLIKEGKTPYKYYIYAPQPDWQTAYEYIKTHRKPDDIIISAQPVFTKLYFGEKGYWISYSLNGGFDRPKTDRYVDAKTLISINDIKKIMNENHGYIILDYLIRDGRVSEEIIQYILDKGKLLNLNSNNDWSSYWVYGF